MNQLIGLLLKDPLPARINEGLLFTAFFLHLVFVLAMIGTAILSFTYFVVNRWGSKAERPAWHAGIMRPFIVLEAFAVVLGVAPLLLVQVGFTVNFFTAVAFLGRYWISLILIIVVALLLLDLYEDRVEHSTATSNGAFALAIIGLLALLSIPAIFVAALVIAENPQQWATVASLGGRVPSSLAWFWLARYLHVIGAAVVVGAAYQYLRTDKEDRTKRTELLMWMTGGIMYQGVVGMVLLAVMPRGVSVATIVLIGIGVIAVIIGFFVLPLSVALGKPPAGLAVSGIALAILLPMLLTRQSIQDRGFLPVRDAARTAAANYAGDLKPYSQPVLAAYEKSLNEAPPDGASRYNQNCAFCHGVNADGHGTAAGDLAIPPESIRDVRTTRAELTNIIVNGMPGTGMSNFRFYTPAQRDQVIDYLDRQYHVFAAPGPVPVPISADARAQAAALWTNTCSRCHGQDGRGTETGRKLIPPPPDFAVYSLQPAFMTQVIKSGYGGTAMASYPQISDDVRWALTELILSKRATQH
jgi:cytochrome c